MTKIASLLPSSSSSILGRLKEEAGAFFSAQHLKKKGQIGGENQQGKFSSPSFVSSSWRCRSLGRTPSDSHLGAESATTMKSTATTTATSAAATAKEMMRNGKEGSSWNGADKNDHCRGMEKHRSCNGKRVMKGFTSGSNRWYGVLGMVVLVIVMLVWKWQGRQEEEEEGWGTGAHPSMTTKTAGKKDGRETPIVFSQDYSVVSRISQLEEMFASREEKVKLCYGSIADAEERCLCRASPLEPQARHQQEGWDAATALHAQSVAAEAAQAKKAAAANKEERNTFVPLDVVLWGDSITEGWAGTHFGTPVARKEAIPPEFAKYFERRQNPKAPLQGLALGVSGDTTRNLLYRLEKEMFEPPPPFVWLLIGTNDFGNLRCSAERVLVGILRVTEHLLAHLPPTTQLIVNALLPRSYDADNALVTVGGHGNGRMRQTLFQEPLWKEIQAVNAALQKYASQRSRVTYFDASDAIFLQDATVPDEKKAVRRDIMPDLLHPNAEGYRLWGQRMVEFLQHLQRQ